MRQFNRIARIVYESSLQSTIRVTLGLVALQLPRLVQTAKLCYGTRSAISHTIFKDGIKIDTSDSPSEIFVII